MENITAVEETILKGFKCIKIGTNVKDNRDHVLRAEVLESVCLQVCLLVYQNGDFNPNHPRGGGVLITGCVQYCYEPGSETFSLLIYRRKQNTKNG